jgi:hypothetical protein
MRFLYRRGRDPLYLIVRGGRGGGFRRNTRISGEGMMGRREKGHTLAYRYEYAGDARKMPSLPKSIEPVDVPTRRTPLKPINPVYGLMMGSKA